jgi:hypothetical protein
MKYLLIASHPTSLNFAIRIDEQTLESALAKVVEIESSRGYLNAIFLIDLDSSDVKRLFRAPEDSWGVSDTAFDMIGIETPDEYFQEAGTMEMDL